MKEYNEEPESLMNKFVKMLFLLIFLLSIALLVYALYTIYLNIPKDPVSLDVIINEGDKNFTYEKTSQFHPNMKFNHNDISYFINYDCDETKTNQAKEAFRIFSEKIEYISFIQVPENADIEVICSPNGKQQSSSEKDYFIAGEGGAKEIVQVGKYNIITNGTILLYKYPDDYPKCETPNIELHELVHVFGFGHSEDKKSLMNPYLVSCDQVLDGYIIDELKRLYSEKNLPDLYFEDISAVKKGRYLDFNLTVKNSGDIDAENVNLTILEDGEVIETRDLKELKFGAGIFMSVENLKLIHLNPKKITFIIDRDNEIDEINEKNNLAEIKFDD